MTAGDAGVMASVAKQAEAQVVELLSMIELNTDRLAADIEWCRAWCMGDLNLITSNMSYIEVRARDTHRSTLVRLASS